MYTADQRALRTRRGVRGVHHRARTTRSSSRTPINLLKARTSGNEEMHRFLAIADGVARSQGRKIIFTTNLPNVNDIDDALIRPGRCFAVKNLRSLEPAEALTLARRLCAEDEERFAARRLRWTPSAGVRAPSRRCIAPCA